MKPVSTSRSATTEATRYEMDNFNFFQSSTKINNENLINTQVSNELFLNSKKLFQIQLRHGYPLACSFSVNSAESEHRGTGPTPYTSGCFSQSTGCLPVALSGFIHEVNFTHQRLLFFTSRLRVLLRTLSCRILSSLFVIVDHCSNPSALFRASGRFITCCSSFYCCKNTAEAYLCAARLNGAL